MNLFARRQGSPLTLHEKGTALATEAVATVTVFIATQGGLNQVMRPSERAAAAGAENVVRGLGMHAHGTAFWVQCDDPAAAERLALYLWDLKVEVLAEALLVPSGSLRHHPQGY